MSGHAIVGFGQPVGVPVEGDHLVVDKLSGSKYEGQFKARKKNGVGMMTYKDGSKYEGQWEADERHGQGVVTEANSDRYSGQFIKDLRHGTYHRAGRVVVGPPCPQCGLVPL